MSLQKLIMLNEEKKIRFRKEFEKFVALEILKLIEHPHNFVES